MDRLLVHVATGLPCSPLARSWAVLECRSAWLVEDTKVRRVPEKPTVLAERLKYTDTMPFN